MKLSTLQKSLFLDYLTSSLLLKLCLLVYRISASASLQADIHLAPLFSASDPLIWFGGWVKHAEKQTHIALIWCCGLRMWVNWFSSHKLNFNWAEKSRDSKHLIILCVAYCNDVFVYPSHREKKNCWGFHFHVALLNVWVKILEIMNCRLKQKSLKHDFGTWIDSPIKTKCQI